VYHIFWGSGLVDEEQITRSRWKTRRKMAWISFWVAVAYPAAAFIAELIHKGSAKTFIDLAPSYYAFATLVVTAYIGFSAMEKK